MKLSKLEEKKLAAKILHIVGECQCPATSKTCAYWKNTDRRDKGGAEWQTDLIIKEIKKI